MEQQVLEILQSTLSPQESIRKNAEHQLEQLFFHPEAGLSLARILVAQALEVSSRQSAGVLLQQYISKHWSGLSPTFVDPSPPTEIKAQVRPIIFSGLSDPERKIRTSAAFAISTIARFDWPEEYPDLLQLLISLLISGNPNSVHGAMRVIVEFVKNDIAEDQLLLVVQDLLPALLQVLGDDKSHSYSTRAECISTFRQVIKMLEIVKEEHPQAVKSALDALGPTWLDAFRQLLEVPAKEEVEQNWESLSLRTELFKTLTSIQSNFPRLLTPYLSTFLHSSLTNLSSLQPLFHQYYLSTSPDSPEPPSLTSEAGASSYQTDIGGLACTVFDFLTPVVRLPKLADVMIGGNQEVGSLAMESLIENVLYYIQVTRSNEEEWMEDPNAFVADEDEDMTNYDARTCGIDLTAGLMDKYPVATMRVLNSQTRSIVSRSAPLKESNVMEWWKPLEAVLALLGGLAEDIRDHLDAEDSSKKSIDLQFLFDQVIPNLLNQSDTPFLQGRAFVFASHCASSFPDQLAAQYLSAAVSALQTSEVSIPVKLSAVKTIKNFCRFIQPSVLQPHTHSILTLLLPLIDQTNGGMLYLLLETIRAVLGVDQETLSGNVVSEVVSRLYTIWERESSDIVVTAIVEETVESLCSKPEVATTVVHVLSPRLGTLILESTTEDTLHIPSSAIQLGNSLIRSRGGPLENELIEGVTCAVIKTLADSDDLDYIQHAMIHLTLIIRKDVEKLINLRTNDGTPGLTALYHLLARFLSPDFSESGGIFVGELVMHLFRKAGGQMGDVLPDLLRALAERIGSAQLPSYIQSLVLPFAYLFGTEHTTSTIELLSSLTVLGNDEMKSALEVVLNAWCETSETVSGSWNIRVTDLGLSKLFDYPDPRLQTIAVRGDLIVDESNRNTIMTRSKTKTSPHRYTQIPFPVKALKLLLKDIQTMGSGKKAVNGAENGDRHREQGGLDEDDGDEDWDDDDDLGGGDDDDEFAFLSSWLDKDGDNIQTQDDDEDLKADPIAQIDMPSHIKDILRNCYTTNSNGIHEMIGSLTETEKGILRGVLTL